MLMQTVTVWIASTTESRNKYFELPFNVSAYFTGGDDVLCELREKCLPLEDILAQNQQRRFILYGLGGSGKTQMALKFASYHQERYDYVAAYLYRLNLALALLIPVKVLGGLLR